MNAAEAQHVCALCGYAYSETEGRACHVGCPLERGCQLLSCPRCGYEVPAPSRLTRWLSRWLHPSSEAGR